jgi:glycopeptide antibiotics resistance protein
VLTAEALWEFVQGPAALAVLAATALLAWPAGVRIARRRRCPRAVAALFVAAVGVILALTLTPDRPAPGAVDVLPPHYLTRIGDPRLVWSALTAAPADTEQLANIALYVPVGLLGRLVWHGAARATLAGVALTVAVETCQYGIIGRAGSLTDIRNNTAGALLGAVVAAVAVGALARARPPAGARHRL